MSLKKILFETGGKWTQALTRGAVASLFFWLMITFVLRHFSWFEPMVGTTGQGLFWSTLAGILAFLGRLEQSPDQGIWLGWLLSVLLILYSFALIRTHGFQWKDLGGPLFFLAVLLPVALSGWLPRSKDTHPAFNNVPPIG